MTTREFIAKGIAKVFDDLADKLVEEGKSESIVAFLTLKARVHMLEEWAKYADKNSVDEKS